MTSRLQGLSHAMRLLACFFFMLCAAGLVRADEYDDLRGKWVTHLTGGSVNTADADIAAQVGFITSNAQLHWDGMRKEPGRTTLWDDTASTTTSAHISYAYQRLRTMALAYATAGSALQGNAALAADVVSGLDWLYAQRYHENKTPYGNWWDWEIGTPQALLDAMALMHAQLTATQRASYIRAVDRFCGDPTVFTFYNAVATGANRLDKALVVVVRGVLGKSAAKMVQGRDAMNQVYPYVTSSDGFYVDGSFIQHYNVPYAGSYGAVLLSGVAKLFYLLNGSSWPITDANAGNVYRWVSDSFQPFLYQGAMMDMLRGRSISFPATSDHLSGRAIVATLAMLAQGAPAAQATLLQGIVKGQVQRDTSFANYYAELRLPDIVRIKAVMANSAITPTAALDSARFYASMDRGLKLAPGYAWGLSLSSSRIATFEYGNGNNKKGWFTGLGMTTLYNADQTQFSDGFWPTVDSFRLPGTTTDGSAGTLVSFKSYPNPNSWVGGSTVGDQHLSSGMQFATSGGTGSTLQGKKSWFVFGDRIVALGSGIATTDGRNVETIVENRKLNAGGSNALAVNGSARSTATGWAERISGVSWAHLAGSVAGADIGYHFPFTATLDGKREARTGSQSQIDNGGSTDTITRHYLSLAVPHGVNPTASGYAYVVLPNVSAVQLASYAAAPTITILENSAEAHAAKDASLKLVGVNFWNDAAKTVSDAGSPVISSDKKASVTMLENAARELHIGIADPTQLNTGSIVIEVHRAATRLIAADAGVTVLRLAPTIKLRVNVNASAGKTYTARLQLGTLTPCEAAADAHVRSGSYADTNYGAATVLDVKKEATGYDRQTFVKFDLNGITGAVSSATLRLYATATGAAGIVNQAFLSAGDAWTEAGLTWNNKPAASTPLGSWTVVPGSHVDIDVTAQVVTALGGDKLVSFLVDAAANAGSTGWVQYASRNAGANKPVLLIVTP
ncbi:polysaccharide lyase family 8 super-sandwich domain-containing protein [Roseateles sp. LYH14W]|uniref:Polysaccharide lyase family 8 super-sandwich domain-containing protein n=1 Tax=Pelomonas parva TaxID=3299032 RepID=A0ABW7EVL2_9BURK